MKIVITFIWKQLSIEFEMKKRFYSGYFINEIIIFAKKKKESGYIIICHWDEILYPT